MQKRLPDQRADCSPPLEGYAPAPIEKQIRFHCPSEFEIPSDYADVTGQPPRVVQIRPEMLGSRMAGHGNMEALRKQYEAGKPVLDVPHIKTAN